MACASHTPLLFDESLADARVCETVRNSFMRLAAFIQEFDPDRVIQFSPDHFHGFHYDNMPSFCVGACATAYGDWDTSAGPLRVDEAFALEVLQAARAADVDAALSYDMTVDHGFTQIWEAMFGGVPSFPVVPIFVNCVAGPLPAYRRARSLGAAVGKFVADRGARILFVASGGLSHDPNIPRLRGASPEVRERLLGRAKSDPEEQARREAQVRRGAALARDGQGSGRPLNPEWDLGFIKLLRSRDWPALEAFTPEAVEQAAGSGGNEVLCWVAAAAALEATGGYDLVQADYVPVPGWIAGMAHLSANGRA